MMSIWEIVHIFEIIIWFIIAGSVIYVVFCIDTFNCILHGLGLGTFFKRWLE